MTHASDSADKGIEATIEADPVVTAVACPICGETPCIRTVACLEEERLTALLDAAAAKGEPLTIERATQSAPAQPAAQAPEAGHALTPNALRQRRYRERQRALRDGDGGVT